MNVFSGELEFEMIRKLSDFLEHFLELAFIRRGCKTRSFNLDKAILKNETAVIKLAVLTKQLFEVNVYLVFADFGTENRLISSGYRALLRRGKHGLIAIAIDRNDHY